MQLEILWSRWHSLVLGRIRWRSGPRTTNKIWIGIVISPPNISKVPGAEWWVSMIVDEVGRVVVGWVDGVTEIRWHRLCATTIFTIITDTVRLVCGCYVVVITEISTIKGGRRWRGSTIHKSTD